MLNCGAPGALSGQPGCVARQCPSVRDTFHALNETTRRPSLPTGSATNSRAAGTTSAPAAVVKPGSPRTPASGAPPSAAYCPARSYRHPRPSPTRRRAPYPSRRGPGPRPDPRRRRTARRTTTCGHPHHPGHHHQRTGIVDPTGTTAVPVHGRDPATPRPERARRGRTAGQLKHQRRTSNATSAPTLSLTFLGSVIAPIVIGVSAGSGPGRRWLVRRHRGESPRRDRRYPGRAARRPGPDRGGATPGYGPHWTTSPAACSTRTPRAEAANMRTTSSRPPAPRPTRPGGPMTDTTPAARRGADAEGDGEP